MLFWLIPAILAVLVLFLVHPSFRYRKARRWRGQRFAHRGLHDPARGVLENTLPAFEAARDAGYGIELDIRFSRDMRLVVFHDNTLERLAGDPREVKALSVAELQALPLKGTDARIPTFAQVLEAVGGRVPLLIELKHGPRDNWALCRAMMAALADYPGEYIVESFDPTIVFWFRLHARQVLRGTLINPMRDSVSEVSPPNAFLMASMLLNVLARPDFVAYNANAPRFLSPLLQRRVFRTPLAGWTVRDRALAAELARRGEMCIFEGRGRPQ